MNSSVYSTVFSGKGISTWRHSAKGRNVKGTGAAEGGFRTAERDATSLSFSQLRPDIA